MKIEQLLKQVFKKSAEQRHFFIFGPLLFENSTDI